MTTQNIEQQLLEKLLASWDGSLTIADLISFADILERAQMRPMAAVLYQTWLARTDQPNAFLAYFNYGVVLSNLNDYAGAERAYRQAVAMAKDFLQPRLNLGLLCERMGNLDQAIEEWRYIEQNCWALLDHCADNKQLVILALNNLGRVHEKRRQFYDAAAFLTKSLTIEPNQSDALHHWVYMRQRLCLWPVFAAMPGISEQKMLDATSAFSILNVTDDLQQQLQTALHYVQKNVVQEYPALSNPAGYQHEKIRVAYLSSDFRLHAVALLTVELFELHDREKFEVYGFCWSAEDDSDLRKRVIAGMDHFVRIHDLTDEQAAQRIRELEIDILVDLQGQTSGARTAILAYRPAPVQITYLGQPGTSGLPGVDYVIADRFLIPEECAHYYSEQPLYMPHVYQVSDRRRGISAKPERAACGLPEQAFVFCSSNNSYKYSPAIFETWIRILRRVPDSVLWLLADNRWAEANLRREAEARGIDPQRLIFAPVVYPEDYRARFQCADLFLDTFPFNSGATASEVLWAGLPILTYSGKAFASRMAGALLTAAGLPELITYSFEEYEERAVWLAEHPERCRELSEYLLAQRHEGVLFDTPRFVADLEEIFCGLIRDLPRNT
jgi:predicted O-linked N-acetylglucosamine transferase (SPINDLY family)